MNDNEMLSYALLSCNADEILLMYEQYCENPNLETLQIIFDALLNRVVLQNDVIVNIDAYNKLIDQINVLLCGSTSNGVDQIGGNTVNIPNLEQDVNNIHRVKEALENKYVNIIGTKEMASSKKFRYKRFQTKFAVQNMPEDADLIEFITEAITEILKQTRDLIPDNAKVGFSMYNKDETSSKVYVSWRRKSQLNAEVILSCIGRVLQSNASFLTQGEMVAQIDYVDIPQGFGRSMKRFGLKVGDFARDKTAIITIANTDHLCLARAIVTAEANYKYKNNMLEANLYSYIRHGRKLQQTLAVNLCENANVNLKNGVTILEIEKIQEYMKN